MPKIGVSEWSVRRAVEPGKTYIFEHTDGPLQVGFVVTQVDLLRALGDADEEYDDLRRIKAVGD